MLSLKHTMKSTSYLKKYLELFDVDGDILDSYN